MIPESYSVESTINNEACEVENLQAQSEMTNGVAVESVTVESLHADNLTSAMTEQVQVNEHYVFDCSDYETEGRTEYVVCGLGSVSDNTASEEKNKPEIGVSDNIGEVMVDFKYEEVDQQDEAPADIKDLDEKGQLQTGALVDLEHLHAQTEIPTGADVEFVTLDALHYDNMFASKEGVCFGHGTMFDYDVLGNTMETISEVESFEEKDQSQIGAADDNEEIEVDLNYKVDEEGEAEDGIESLEEKDLSETEFKVSMVNVVAISILISALISVLIGSTASSYVKKGNSSTLNLVISICQQALTNKQFNASPDVPCSTIHIFQDIPSSWNWIKEPLNSKLSNLQKSSSYRLMGQDASAKHEIQQKRGATAVCQQPLLTKLNTSLIMPVGTKHKIHKRPSSWNWITESCHSEMSSLQNSSYQTQGLNELYKSESQEKSDSGKTIEERPWLQWTPQWAHCLYGRSKTIDKNTIKNCCSSTMLIPT
uniref:uncharacterized protein LOC105349561 n=1 Tax=Fragaria vesca subsp. vesca TaxID=101020 RepID=UPI0005C93E80|nr:PREDICTED: uncharacterized protein LOC105349561 [Fragaria vesca subsp. vesca]XP_011457775.1 PREDICTED: uncharacterized protein LOC105349561 [Fragaria vesca subsp. vesca]